MLVRPTIKEFEVLREYLGDWGMYEDVQVGKQLGFKENQWEYVAIKLHPQLTEYQRIKAIVELHAEEFLGYNDDYMLFLFN